MSVVDDYLETLHGAEKDLVSHMYDVVRAIVPDATEELSYAMPAFKYEGKGLIAVMVNGKFLSLYPFCSSARLGLDLSDYEGTTGSIHFGIDHPIPDQLLWEIVLARMRLITRH